MVRSTRAFLALAAVAAVAIPVLHAGSGLPAVSDVEATNEELVAPLRGSRAAGVISSPPVDGVATRPVPNRTGPWGGAALVAALAGIVSAARWSRNLGRVAGRARSVWWRPGSLERAPPLALRF